VVRTDDGLAEDGARTLFLTTIQTEQQLKSFETRPLCGAAQDEGLFHHPLVLRSREAASKDATKGSAAVR
jgi:hypothetical protein